MSLGRVWASISVHEHFCQGPNGSNSQRNTYKDVHYALFMIGEIWKQLKYWLNKLWHMHTMTPCIASENNDRSPRGYWVCWVSQGFALAYSPCRGVCPIALAPATRGLGGSSTCLLFRAVVLFSAEEAPAIGLHYAWFALQRPLNVPLEQLIVESRGPEHLMCRVETLWESLRPPELQA